MLLTKSQTQRFWRDWAAVKRQLKASGSTDAQCEAERYALLQRAGFDSLTKVDTRSGFDRVLAELGAMRDDLPKTIETDNTKIGEARRLRHVIRTELLPCLALYEEDPAAYLTSIIQDKIRWSKTDRPTRPPTIDDLSAEPIFQRRPPCYALRESPSQLEQVLMTLNARLHTKRKEHGHTIHDMRTQAGLECPCRTCQNSRRPIPDASDPSDASDSSNPSNPSPQLAHAADPF